MEREPIVLVVDDDEAVRGALARLLEREGIRVVSARSLAQARQRIALHRPTLRVAIVDLGLGEENGLDLVSELKRSDSPPAILVFSAAGDGAARAKVLELGVEEVLTKPASPAAILAAIRRRLDGASPGTTGERMRTHLSPDHHRPS